MRDKQLRDLVIEAELNDVRVEIGRGGAGGYHAVVGRQVAVSSDPYLLTHKLENMLRVELTQRMERAADQNSKPTAEHITIAHYIELSRLEKLPDSV